MSPGSGDVSSMVMAGVYSRAPKAWHNLSLQRLRPKPHVLPRCPANRHFSPVVLIPGAVAAHGWTVAGIRALFTRDRPTPWPPTPSRRPLISAVFAAHGWAVARIRALFTGDPPTPWPPTPSRRALLNNPTQRSSAAHADALLRPIRFRDHAALHARAFPSQLPPRAGHFP